MGTPFTSGTVLRLVTQSHYLRSQIERQEKWETTSNERYLLKLLKIVNSLFHKYEKEMKYHNVAYHTILRRFMLFCQDDYIKSEYKQHFKEKIKVLGAYTWEVAIRKQPGRYGAQDRATGTKHRKRRRHGRGAGINKEKIPGNRVPPQLGQAPIW